MKLVLTCEHAGNRLPQEYKNLFQDAGEILNSHRGFDPGAHDLYCHLKKLASLERAHRESRLLIEVNRSLHHPALFSEFTRALTSEAKNQIIRTYYLPYRTEVENAISNYIKEGEEVLHLSIHSFTPVLNGNVRKADIGLLYDPTRKAEKDWCGDLKRELAQIDNSLRLRMNYPYRGSSDGFNTYLRKRFMANYIGIEIEVNQKYAYKNKMPLSLKYSVLTAIEIMLRS